MRWSIRYQLLIPLLALLLGVVGMSIWAAVASVNQARDQIEGQVRDIARTLHGSSFPLSENVLHLMKGFSGADYVVLDKEGQLQGTTLTSHNLKLPLPEADSDWDKVTLREQVELDGITYLYAGLRLRQGRNADSVLYILYPESLWRDAWWQAVRPSLLLGIVGGLAAIVLSIILAQRLTRRVQALERRTRLIAEGDFSPMPLPQRNDELRDLSRCVNEMAQRLAQLHQTVQKNERLRLLGQVSGGLAHQLRNGVTGARLAVQVHAQECGVNGDAEALQVALRQLSLVELHLTRFLDLGRNGRQKRQPCSLVALLRDVVTLLGPQCRHAHIDLHPHLAANDDFITTGDAGQLSQVFLNVLTNAIEAAGPAGWVELGIKRLGNQRVQVVISDSGPGLEASVADRLFEPFVTGKRDGVGLGLAVARQVVEAHQGRIHWERQADRTCFYIELPLEPST
jgi:signal transduction histidine kinase